jgi:hypothetical protein
MESIACSISAATSFALGVIASMLANYVTGPIMDSITSYHLTRFFGVLFRRFTASAPFDGEWEQTWEVDSDRFPEANYSSVRFYRFHNWLAGDAAMMSASGAHSPFRIVAHISPKGHVSGKWYDTRQGGYYGTFQLTVDPLLASAEGFWSGWSSDGPVKVGRWIWRKKVAV